MKPTAVVVVAANLFQILMPGLSYASEQRQRNRTDGAAAPVIYLKSSVGGKKRQRSRDYSTTEIEKRAMQFFEKDVAVILRGQIDLTKLKTGRYVHVVYNQNGVKATSTGMVKKKTPEGFVVKSAAGFHEAQQIIYANIDTLIVTKNRRAMKRWQLRSDGRFVLMSQGALETPKIKKG